MKKILIIHTGGTFGMSPALPDKTLLPGQIHDSIDTYIPFLGSIADIQIQIPFNLDSSDIGPMEWETVYNLIFTEMDNFDGFIIIHGTDTLTYSAAALSFLLYNLKKPVIFTGSQRPLSELRTDARSNLINSVQLATYPIPEVSVCFNNKLYRGNRTKKISIESFGGFKSPNYPPLAEIGLNINIITNNISSDSAKINLEPKFETNIATLIITPGSDPEFYGYLTRKNIRAVILQGFGAGNFPILTKNWLKFIETCVKEKILVIMGSQSAHGKVDLDLYKSGKLAREAGAISMGKMTMESGIVKLMLLLGNFAETGKILRLFQTDIAGEME